MSQPLPTGIGPHEGREFEMMRSGTKHIALFHEIKPDGIDAMLEEGFTLLKFFAFEFSGTAYFSWILFRAGYETQALRLKDLVQQPHTGIDPDREHEIGRLLGYTTTEVEIFLQHFSTKTA